MDAAEFESLPEAESIRIRSFLNLQLTMLYRHFYFAKDGAIRGAVWEAEIRVTKPLLRQAWVRQHWSEMRYVYSDEFVEFVDGLIREGEANPTIPPISSVLAMVESLLFHLDNTLFRFGWRYDIAVVEANQCLKFTGAA
jgi:hypothetical protein